MRPLQLALSFESGGRREAIATLARGFESEGVGCDLACVEQLGCEPSVVGNTFGYVEPLRRDSDGSEATVRRLIRLCDERNINLVHAHDAASQWIASRLRSQRPKIKLLMTFHRSLGFESAGWKAKLRNAIAGRATDAIVVGSRERKHHFLRENFIRSGKVVRIPFGVDLERFRPDQQARQELRCELGVDEGQTLIGAVGHFGEEKGIDVAIQGFRKFTELATDANSKLVVVGRGTAEQEQRIRALANGAGDRILFAGFRRDVERFFAAMDLFLHVPRQEAFGLVVAEAMACGVPVIGADVGGVPDMVRQDVTGCLVPVADHGAIASVLNRMITNSSDRQILGANAQRIAQTEYPVSLYVNRHMDLYRDILSGRRPRGVDESPDGNETE